MSYQTLQDAQMKEEWRVAKLHFETCQDLHEQLKGNIGTLKFLIFGYKAGRLLARLAMGPHIATPIHSLRDKNGTFIRPTRKQSWGSLDTVGGWDLDFLLVDASECKGPFQGRLACAQSPGESPDTKKSSDSGSDG